MNESNKEETKGKLKRDLGLFSLISLGVGSIIGSGVFVMPAVMGSVAGPGFTLAIILCGIVVSFLAIAYAELGSTYPKTGGPYSLPRLALGNQGGFVMGWGYYLYAFIGTAAILEAFMIYLSYFIPGLSNGLTMTVLGTIIASISLWLLTIINVLGVKWGGLYAIITTIGKIVPLIIFGVVGLLFFTSSNFTPYLPFGIAGVTLAIAFEFWAFTGFEAIVVPIEEVKKPHKNIPLAMILTIVIVVIVYLFISFAFGGMINWNALGLQTNDWGSIGNLASPFSDVANAIPGLFWLAILITIGAIISTAGASGDWVLLQSRIPYEMALDGLFWSPMGNINKKYRTPVKSLILSSILTNILLITIPAFPPIALLASITALVPYTAAAISVPIMRKTDPNTKRPFRLPANKVVAGIGFVLGTFLVYWASWPWTFIGGILMLIGFPLYYLTKNHITELKRSAWIIVYLIGLVLISYLGDTNYIYENFLPFGPIGFLIMPYDIIVLTIFSLLIYYWAYKTNADPKFRPSDIEQIEKEAED